MALPVLMPFIRRLQQQLSDALRELAAERLLTESYERMKATFTLEDELEREAPTRSTDTK